MKDREIELSQENQEAADNIPERVDQFLRMLANWVIEDKLMNADDKIEEPVRNFLDGVATIIADEVCEEILTDEENL